MKTRHGIAGGWVALALLIGGAAPVAEAAEAAPAEVLFAGTWTKKAYDIAGGWRIERAGEALVVVLEDDFVVRRAPDLKIFLSTLAVEKVSDRNATSNSILVAELERFDGGQRYEVPRGTDLGAYKSVLIHCQQYSKLFAAAGLEP